MATKNTYAHIEWSPTILEDLGFTDGLDRAFAKYCRDIMKPYVPYKTGKLSRSNRIVRDEFKRDWYNIIYDTSYAEAQYQGLNGSGMPESIWDRKTTPHPLATSFWDKFAIMANEEKLVSLIDHERKLRSKT